MKKNEKIMIIIVATIFMVLALLMIIKINSLYDRNDYTRKALLIEEEQEL